MGSFEKAVNDVFEFHWDKIVQLGRKHNEAVKYSVTVYKYLTETAEKIDENFQILNERVKDLEAKVALLELDQVN